MGKINEFMFYFGGTLVILSVIGFSRSGNDNWIALSAMGFMISLLSDNIRLRRELKEIKIKQKTKENENKRI